MNLKNIKDVRKTILVLASISLILVIFLGFSVYKIGLTGRAIEENYTYTKAICDDKNFCEDYEIVCGENKVVSINPTGYGVQNNDGWQDPRDELEQNMNGLCNISE